MGSRLPVQLHTLTTFACQSTIGSDRCESMERIHMISPSRRLDFTEIPVIDIGSLIHQEQSEPCIDALRSPQRSRLMSGIIRFQSPQSRRSDRRQKHSSARRMKKRWRWRLRRRLRATCLCHRSVRRQSRYQSSGGLGSGMINLNRLSPLWMAPIGGQNNILR